MIEHWHSGRELQAQTDLHKTIAEFQRATSSTFQVNNISVVTDAPAPDIRMVDPSGKDLTNDFREQSLFPPARGASLPVTTSSVASRSSVRRQEQ